MFKIKFDKSNSIYTPIHLFLTSIFLILLGNTYSFAANTDSLFNQTYDTIYIASEPDYPPYCFVDNKGKADGFAVELFKASAHAAGLNTNIKIGLWNVIKQELTEGKIHALPLVSRTPEREQIFDFTLPYISLHGAVFVRQGERKLNSIDDLKEKEILVMRGDNAEEFLRRNNISNKVVTTNTFEEAFIKLANGEGDAILTQRVIGLSLAKDLKLKNIVASKLQVPEFRRDFCFAVQKGNTELLSRLNEGLSIVIANNTYNEIQTKWFGPALNPKVSTRDIIRIAVIVLIPILSVVALFLIFFLRKVIQSQTKQLHQEIKERKEVESSLKQNEYYLNKAQEIGQIGTWELNIKENSLVWTEESHRIFGVPPGTLVSLDRFFEIIHPDDRAYVAEKWNEALHHEPYDIEHRLLVNNKLKWVREKADIEFNSEGEAIMAIGFVQDITNLKISEAKIINNEKSLRELLNNLSAGVVVHSADTSIIRTNPKACELLGLSEDQIKGKIADKFPWEFIREDGSIMPYNEHPVNIVSNTQKQLSNYIVGVNHSQKNEVVWLLVNGIPVLNSKKELIEIIINFVDITDLRKTEEALVENTTFMNKIVESSAISTWISDDKGTAIRTNQACLDLFGAKKDEVLGKYNIFKDVVVEKHGYMPDIHKVFEEGIVANILIDYNFGEVDHVSVKNATHKILNSIFTPVTNNAGEVSNVIVQTIDLTEIKQIEANAIHERNKAQQYLDIAGVMLLILDHNGIVELINPKGCEILGYPKDEIIGKHWYNTFLPNDEKAKVQAAEQKIYNGHIEDVRYFENKIITKSGEERLIAWRNSILTDDRGEIIGTLSSGEDITDRKKAEQELIQTKQKTEENEAKLLAALESMTDGVFIADTQMNIINVNDAYLKLTEFKDKNDLETRINEYPDLFDVCFESGEIAPLDMWAGPRALRGETAINNIYIIKRKGSDESWIGSYSFAPIRNIKRQIVGCVVTIRDVTDTINKEKELIKAKEKAEESDFLKTSFLQNLSHEIRTPMNSIMGFASLLPDEEDKALIDSYSKIIEKNSEQLVHIIDDIVLFSRLQNKQMLLQTKNFDLHKLLSDVRNSFNIPEYQKNVELLIDLNSDAPLTVNSDHEKVWQVFTNLISNAFKYTPSGKISIGAQKRKDGYLCFVSDSGIGIPKNEIEQIFDRFYRASNVNKGKIGGTGLGLSIVHELVQLLGGTLWVESEVGKGSTFNFILPS